jgi:hypothetical protein
MVNPHFNSDRRRTAFMPAAHLFYNPLNKVAWLIRYREQETGLTTQHKHQRTGNATTATDGMKVHLRLVRLNGYMYRILTLRPGTTVAYSTNYFHGTWHIISDMSGSRLLARLLWALSYQRQPNTLFLLHGEHLQPTPFDAAPSDPIVLAPTPHTALCEDVLRSLKSRIQHLGPPTQTVRLHTYGLDVALADVPGFHAREYPREQGWHSHLVRSNDIWQQERMQRWGGFLCYTAPPILLRIRAVAIHQLHTERHSFDGMGYQYLADRGEHRFPDGEVQIFNDYGLRLKEAEIARKQVAVPENSHPDKLSLTICKASYRLRDRRLHAPHDS